MKFPKGRQILPVMPKPIPAPDEKSAAEVAVKSLASTVNEIIRRGAAGERIKATSEERDRQLAVCRQCDRFDPSVLGGHCRECKCVMKVKAWLLGFCPLGKHPVDTPQG